MHIVRDVNAGQTTKSVYDMVGRLISSTDARGRTSSSTYDGEGRLTYSKDSDGNETWNYYDVYGRQYRTKHHPATVSGEPVVNIITRSEYDDAGRVVRTVREKEDGTLLSENRTVFESSDSGRTETSIDRMGGRSVSIYDFGGRLVRSESYLPGGALGGWTAYEYDALGRTVRTVNDSGITNQTVYDALGRTESTTVSGPGQSLTTSYTYDAAGRQLTVTAPGGSMTQNVYDDLGRVERGGLL